MRRPKGFSADTPHIESSKMRHYCAIVEMRIRNRPPKDLAGAINERFRDLLPLMEWLRPAAPAGADHA